MSVNSAAVLRLTGRGSGPIAGVSRGRSTSRGRGKTLLNTFLFYFLWLDYCCGNPVNYFIDNFALVILNNLGYLNS